ncbi:hypothetical protein BDV23DRAFT_193185 [Aspergillus alliaceus]|uniref:FAD/NAD(P)-binding domain-containing protein n=1 Tax=Petromyces alliaceus TaxID=209559 RepID=A0A5N7CBD8_PETAA|nr:hypothetical protein BDV23DRAFT_193185 [Aspergillus alliaceus]
MNEIELLIVGAGLHGLLMAKTYLEVSPHATLLIIDRAQSVGGSWAAERLYPGLKTNNVVGSYEFSDFPMIPERYGLKPGDHIPGRVVHQYFHDFAERFDLYRRIAFGTTVDSMELQNDGRWKIAIDTDAELGASHRSTKICFAHKVVLATGLTSEPYLPSFSGQSEFLGTILHAKQLKAQTQALENSTRTAVIGGNKSAWDACYQAAHSGAHVDMIIRPSGGGPSFVWPVSFNFLGLQTSLSRLTATRFCACFDPSPLGAVGPLSSLQRFLHHTPIGQTLLSYFWTELNNLIRRLNGYNDHPELKKLEPWITPFWLGNSLSIHNYESNWFNLVRDGKVHIHIADVTSLSKSRVHLSNGTTLDADTIVCCTGWNAQPSVRFEPADVAVDLCFRGGSTRTDCTTGMDFTESIYFQHPSLQMFPRREPNAPPVESQHLEHKKDRTSFDLYKLSVPWQPTFMKLKNLAFIGAHASIHTTMVAQAQCLWVTAFFHGCVAHLNPENIDLEAVRHEAAFYSTYGQLRRPGTSGGSGGKYPDLVFDSLPFIDTLLSDLGLETQRKKSFMGEIFEPYQLKDYRGLVQEWTSLHFASLKND